MIVELTRYSLKSFVALIVTYLMSDEHPCSLIRFIFLRIEEFYPNISTEHDDAERTSFTVLSQFM